MHYNTFASFVYLSIICILAQGCTRSLHPSDKHLKRVEILSDTDYDAARACLDSIDRGVLGDTDLHFYDFLDLKLNDKEYIEHTSDSAILALIDYASQSRDTHYA